MKSRSCSVSFLPFLLAVPVLLQAQVALTTSTNPSPYGSPLTLTVTVTPSTATGRVTFYDGATILGIRRVSSGTASLSTSLLAGGRRNLRAYYAGDAYNPAATSNTVTQTVRATPGIGFRPQGPPVSVAGTGLMAFADDFNGDGKPDFAVLTANGVQIFLGNGDGTFQPGATYTLGLGPLSIALADFDGDGKTDIAVSTADSQRAGIVSLLFGNGDGTFRRPLNSYAATGTLYIADVNGDGLPDLVTISFFMSVSVQIGKGDGTFGAPILVQSGAGDHTTLALADFNGDGKVDLVWSSPFAAPSVAFGNGDSTFQPETPLMAPAGTCANRWLSVADFNNDGNPDVLLSCGSQTVYLGDGHGSFTMAGSYPVPGAGTPGDFDGDGKIDLAVLGDDSSISILNGNGAGSFALALHYATAYQARGLMVLDVDGDGRADLAAITPFNGLNILLGTTAGTSVTVTGPSAQSALTNARFSSPLEVTVIKDGSPLSGAIVNFTAPTSGASAVLSSYAAVTTVAGVASVPATANAVTGKYAVTASYDGAAALFSLTNANVGTVTAVAGTPQSALIGMPFTDSLVVLVKDASGTPAANVLVNFAVPTSGATAAVPPATTNENGLAFTTASAAGATGTYSVTASVQSATATFTLTNTAVATMTVRGAAQAATAGTAFVRPLQVTVKDNNGNPAKNVTVLFAAPAEGASAQLSLPASSTDVNGVAGVSAIANAIIGNYSVIASAGNLSVKFNLSNLPAGASNIALGKTATQSSTLTQYPGAGAASAIDNNRDGAFFDNSVTHTAADANAWWQVDLGVAANLSGITIWNRSDPCCINRLSDYWVFASNTPFAATDTPATLQGRPGTLAIHQTTAPNPSTTLPVSTQARYVRVQLSGTGNLSLAEVEIMGTPTAPAGVNLSAGKPATQSSTLAGYPGSGAGSAVDGNTDGNFFHNSVTHTNSEANPWWQVDLGTSATVDSIVIWNRTDCCADRLAKYVVAISDTPFAPGADPSWLQGRPATFVFTASAAPNPSTTIPVGGYQGQFVLVRVQGYGVLSLAEVQVFGTPGTSSLANAALRKPASQSSTLAGYPSADAGSAVDGNTDGAFFDYSVTHTGLDMNAWWQVDLGGSADIDSIVIWNRMDWCCNLRLSEFWVFVSDTPFNSDDSPATLQNRPGTFSSLQTMAPLPSLLVQIPGAKGRYVRVQLARAGYLSLAEVQVWSRTPIGAQVVNLAAGKQASQSSTYPYASAAAGSAVDGKTDGNFFNGSVTHTSSEANAWWQVDLGVPTSISSVAIWNRTDCCGDRLGDYWLFVSDTPFAASDTPATLAGRAGVVAIHRTSAPDPMVSVPVSARGRYVRVQLSGTNPLSLAEVQVFGFAN